MLADRPVGQPHRRAVTQTSGGTDQLRNGSAALQGKLRDLLSQRHPGVIGRYAQCSSARRGEPVPKCLKVVFARPVKQCSHWPVLPVEDTVPVTSKVNDQLFPLSTPHRCWPPFAARYLLQHSDSQIAAPARQMFKRAGAPIGPCRGFRYRSGTKPRRPGQHESPSDNDEPRLA